MAERTRNAELEPKPVRERARAFAFEGLPEKDRFGIFDPALRGFFLVGLMFAVVFGVGSMFDATRGGRAPWGEAAVLIAAVVILGAFGYRYLWRKPRERETLLAMAARDDEARAARARKARDALQKGAQGGGASRARARRRP